MGFKIRQMTGSDVPAAMALKETVGWNQIPEDWHCYLRLDPSGCFVGLAGEQVVASATALSYDSAFGWIGMILVDPDFRRRGYATRMMEKSLEYLKGKGCYTQRLDATEAGARVYQKFGFTEETIVERWVRRPDATLGNATIECQPISLEDLDDLCPWDADAFGACRRSLLAWYQENSAPSLCRISEDGVHGFVMGRIGSGAFQLGPLVADENQTAARLTADFLNSIPSHPVIADVSRDNPLAIQLLEKFDFTCSRRLIRMYRGNSPPASRKDHIYFLAGFEFG